MVDKEIIAVKNEIALEAFQTGDGLKEIVQRARDVVEDFEHDTTTAAGRKRTASLANRVARFKVKLDGMRKDLVSDWKKKAAVVDANGRVVRDELDKLKIEARKPLTDWEQAKEKRANELNNRILRIDEFLVFDETPTLDELIARVGEVKSYIIDGSFEDFIIDAEMRRMNVIGNLQTMIAQEQRHLEIIQLRQEKEERERIEAQKVVDEEKAENAEKLRNAEEARKKALKEAKSAKLRAQKEREDRLATEAKAKAEQKAAEQQARLDEQRKIAEEKMIEREQYKLKLADKKYIEAVKQESAESLLKWVDVVTAKDIIQAIVDGKVDHVTLNY